MCWLAVIEFAEECIDIERAVELRRVEQEKRPILEGQSAFPI